MFGRSRQSDPFGIGHPLGWDSPLGRFAAVEVPPEALFALLGLGDEEVMTMELQFSIPLSYLREQASDPAVVDALVDEFGAELKTHQKQLMDVLRQLCKKHGLDVGFKEDDSNNGSDASVDETEVPGERVEDDATSPEG